jgi:hypothetical protein
LFKRSVAEEVAVAVLHLALGAAEERELSFSNLLM